jgi:F-type H+-transporting ATPase subunit b
VGNIISSLYVRVINFATDIPLDSAKETNSEMKNYIFGLEPQLLADVLVVALSVFVLFLALSYLLFNPARELLKKRQEKIDTELEFSAKEVKDAMALKSDYEAKLKTASLEVDEILSEGRKKAIKRENEIVDEAKTEASRIKDRAYKEIELEKSKVRDEVKQEVISVASVMAGKIIAGSIDEAKQTLLVEEALNEMGDNTWQK